MLNIKNYQITIFVTSWPFFAVFQFVNHFKEVEVGMSRPQVKELKHDGAMSI